MINHFKTAWRTGAANLGFVILILAVVACSCPKLDELTKTSNTSTTSPASSPSTTSPAASYNLSMDNYNKLRIGMPRADVEEILGGKGSEVSSSSGGGMRFTVNKWEGENFRSIILTFKNDKIMSKSQVGLDK